MGTKRRVCIWHQRRKNEYLVEPPGWKPEDGDIIFSNQGQMLEFARASRLVLKERPNGRGVHDGYNRFAGNAVRIRGVGMDRV